MTTFAHESATAVARRRTPARARTREIAPAPPRRTVAGAIVASGLVLALVAVGLQTTGYLVDSLVLGWRTALLDADSDFSVFAWAGASAIAGGAAAAATHAVVLHGRRLRLAAIASVLAFLSLDETVRIHERLTDGLPALLGAPGYVTRLVWPAVFLPLLGTTFVLVWALARSTPTPARRALRAGLVLLVVAVAAEMLSTVWFAADATVRSTSYVVEVAFEEGCELAGWALVATGLLATTATALCALGADEARRARSSA